MRVRHLWLAFAVAVLAAAEEVPWPVQQHSSFDALIAAKPAPAPESLLPLVGEYGWQRATVYVIERGGRLCASTGGVWAEPVDALAIHAGVLHLRGALLPRRPEVAAAGAMFRFAPLRPVEELRSEALAARPPRETGEFRKPDLVDITSLDPSIHLDIRYATTNNFMSTPFYREARALLQRPAAEALVRASRRLAPYGYGLLIHDAYRPWFVTKMFWEATPPDKRQFVADPSAGSRHNRGCAVDVTLYDIRTGKVLEMPGGYDEMSERSYPDYPGGTALQRWRRDLLRAAIEPEGFTIYPYEWWHFDYRDWRRYPILNVAFEDIRDSSASKAARTGGK